MLFLYRIASGVAAWLVRPFLFVCAVKEGFVARQGLTKEDLKKGLEKPLRRARELCAIPTQHLLRTHDRRDGHPSLLWLHGVDIGEAQVALRLAQDLWHARPQQRVLITTTSRAAAELIAKNTERRLQHQFAPLDSRAWYRRFLRHWRPSLAVRCENEFWPNSIIETRRHCPLLFVQAKMSEKSFRRWQALSNLALSVERGIAQRTMRNIDLALCQDENSARFLRALGVRKTKVAGNLKSLPAPRTIDKNTESWFCSLLAHKTLWIAASTHASEEPCVIEAHRNLRTAHPDALCVVAPRYLERVPAIAQRLTEQDEAYQLRSSRPSSLSASFFLLDSFLELNSLYRWAQVVFVGGTFADKGGHNLFEPARHGGRILHGPHLHNTHAPLLKDLQRTQEVCDASDLALRLRQEFDKTHNKKGNKKENKEEDIRKEKARRAIERYHRGLRADVLQSLEPYLKSLDKG